MSSDRLMNVSERWFRLLQRLYPPDFRDDMGDARRGDVPRPRARRASTAAASSARRASGCARSWTRCATAPASACGPPPRGGAAATGAATWSSRLAGCCARRRSLAATVGTLTIGLGMFAVVYTVVQKILIEPMPYQDPGDLYFVWRDYGPIFDLKRGWLGGTDVAELQKAGGVIEDAAGLQRQLATFSAARGRRPDRDRGDGRRRRTCSTCSACSPRSAAASRRTKSAPAAQPVIVLTHELWNRLGADPGDRRHGRAAERAAVHGHRRDAAALRVRAQREPRPAAARRRVHHVRRRTSRRRIRTAASYAALIRARRGTSPEAVAAAVDAVGRAIDARDFNSRGLKLYPVGLKADLVAGVRPALLVLGPPACFLVLMLMVNLASVLLARAAQREHEFAVSRALGANGARRHARDAARRRPARRSSAARRARWSASGARARSSRSRRSICRAARRSRSTGASARSSSALGVLLGLLAATVPALWAARTSLSSLLASSAVRGGGGHGRMRRGMIVAQVALSLVLLSSGGLVVRSFERLLRADPGFNAEGVLTMRVRMPAAVLPDNRPTPRVPGSRRARRSPRFPASPASARRRALPLTAAAMSDDDHDSRRARQHRRSPSATRRSSTSSARAPATSRSWACGCVAGRAFDAVRHDGVREALIDQPARRAVLSRRGNPLGANDSLRRQAAALTIVGVVEQARLYDVHQDGRPQLYVRAEDWGFAHAVLRRAHVRDRATAGRVIPRCGRRSAHRPARSRCRDVRTMDEIVDEALRQQRTSAVLIGGFALGALLLAAMGLFGVVSGSVTRRRHELAVRLALGADHGRVLRLVLGEGALLVGLGVLIGVPGIYAAGGLIRGVLVGVSPSDPLTLVSVAIGLGARRHGRLLPAGAAGAGIDPARSLRL